VPQFQDLARPILLAISQASGPRYEHVTGAKVMEELRGMLDSEPDTVAVRNTLEDLRSDGYIVASGGMGTGAESVALIRLDTRGRRAVEGWPTEGALSSADVEALVAAFEKLAADPGATEEERGLADEAATAVKRLPIELAKAALYDQLRRMGFPV
jgi:DNA-binding PadR family transcriptional regulator